VSEKIPQLTQISRFILVFMDGQGYLSLSSFHYESLPNGEVMDKIDKWLTIDELAGYIKMSRTKLYGMAQRGEIPASKIGTQWRFDRDEIDQWMKAHPTGNVGSDSKDKKQ
jgi:PTS system nitrogen regulatory IIA component